MSKLNGKDIFVLLLFQVLRFIYEIKFIIIINLTALTWCDILFKLYQKLSTIGDQIFIKNSYSLSNYGRLEFKSFSYKKSDF